MFVKNELQYVQQEVKELEKKYFELKEKKTLDNLDIYRERIKDYDGTVGIVMEVKDKDINLLKSIADNLVNEMKEGFVFFANVKEGNVNFIARSTCSVNAGMVVKGASQQALGNGGGIPTFAQGGGKTTSNLKDIIEYVENSLRDAK